MRIIAAFLAMMVLALPAYGQEGREQARQLEAERDAALARAKAQADRAQAIGADIAKLQHELVRVGQRINQQTALQAQAQDRLIRLEGEANAKAAKIQQDHKDLQELLAALQRSEMSPPPPLAVSPDDALSATRSAILLAATVPILRDRANALKVELAELTKLRTLVDEQRTRFAQEEQRLRAEETQLTALVVQRRKLEAQAQSEASTSRAHAAQLADRAASLRELIRQLEAEAARMSPSIKPEPEKGEGQYAMIPRLKPDNAPVEDLPPVFHSPTERFTDFRGHLPVPVSGKVEFAYGKSPDPDRDTGIVYAATGRSQVLSPADGRVAYAGNFRNYGKLLILDVGEGYHIVLAGLATSYVVQDQTVLAGEPVGKMPDRRSPAPEFYLEFRKHGRPFNPAPWLKQPQKTG